MFYNYVFILVMAIRLKVLNQVLHHFTLLIHTYLKIEITDLTKKKLQIKTDILL